MSAPKYPPPELGVFRLTQSDTELYLKCGIRRDFALVDKHRSATVKMTIGSAVSRAAAHDNRCKLNHGFGAPLREIVEVGVAGYEEELKETYVDDTPLAVAAGKDSAAGAARAYGEHISPLIEEVLLVEEPIVAEIKPQFQIAGTPDLIEPVGLGDTKTGKYWDQADANHSRQLTFYGLLHQARFGRLPRRYWIDNVYQTERGEWKAHRIYTYRTPYHFAGLLEILERVKLGIEARIALPPPEFGAWYCSQDYCPFWKKCPVTQGENR